MDKVVSFAAAAAAVAFASVANAGIVNKPVKMYENGSQVASFWVSTYLVEATLMQQSGSSPDDYYGLSVDMRDTSMTVTADWDIVAPSGIQIGSITWSFVLPTNIQFTSFTVASTNNVANMTDSRLSFSGNTITINMQSPVQYNAPGASFTLNYTSTTIPGPAGLAAVALAIGSSRRRR